MAETQITASTAEDCSHEAEFQLHCQEAWTTEGVKYAVMALHYGASPADLVSACRSDPAASGNSFRDEELGCLSQTAYRMRDVGIEHPDRVVLARLWQQASLSEGQCSKALAIDRIGFRKICDDLGLSQYDSQEPAR